MVPKAKFESNYGNSTKIINPWHLLCYKIESKQDFLFCRLRVRLLAHLWPFTNTYPGFSPISTAQGANLRQWMGVVRNHDRNEKNLPSFYPKVGRKSMFNQSQVSNIFMSTCLTYIHNLYIKLYLSKSKKREPNSKSYTPHVHSLWRSYESRKKK